MVNNQWRFYSMLWLVVSVLLTACQPGFAPTRTVACNTQFEATVHHGPNAGLSVTGTLLFFLDHSGEVSGVVVTGDGREIPTSGQANGRAINLTFQLDEQQYLFGVGSAENPINTCTGYWGGSFTGPASGDSGDWLASDGIDATIQADEITFNPNVTLSPAESPDTQNFTCGETTCSCGSVEDCKRLQDTGICKTLFRYGVPNQTCQYRDPPPSKRQGVND